jgi:hypothetical protein
MTTTFGPNLALPFLGQLKDESFNEVIASNKTSVRLEHLNNELTKIFESEVS